MYLEDSFPVSEIQHGLIQKFNIRNNKRDHQDELIPRAKSEVCSIGDEAKVLRDHLEDI
jgi:hypothetical protein